MKTKVKIATTSLAGCFGCHMSLLDIDEKLIDLLELIELDKTPLTDIKTMGECDVGLIEGGVCNEENVKILKEFRKHCKILVAVGACAINGGIPAMRNQLSVADCLKEAYVDGDSVVDAQIPNDPELPLLLDKVYPIDEVVKIDYFLPGCPPSADAIWSFLSDLLNNKPITLDYGQIAYD
ncbi:MAG: NADP oxidoreductase [Gammaproteobacteria bacterium]|nr:NADP oxidoreductase [Gammaproteobacteria bacterium]